MYPDEASCFHLCHYTFLSVSERNAKWSGHCNMKLGEDWEGVRVPTGSWWSSFLPRSETWRHHRWSWQHWWGRGALALQERRQGSPGGWTENICSTDHFSFLLNDLIGWCMNSTSFFGTLHVKTTTSVDIFLLGHMIYICSLVQFKNKNYMLASRIHDSNCVCVCVCDYLGCGGQQGFCRRGSRVLHFDLLFSRFISSWGRAIHGWSRSIALRTHKHTHAQCHQLIFDQISTTFSELCDTVMLAKMTFVLVMPYNNHFNYFILLDTQET